MKLAIINMKRISRGVWTEIFIRVALLCIFFFSENMRPFIREIQPEEYWLYKFPSRPSIVPSESLYAVSIFSTLFVALVAYGFDRKPVRAFASLSVPTLALPLTGIITNIIKISVGRPRPDYFNRCYGPSYIHFKDLHKPCTGDPFIVMDGRRSFPSGHSSMSFCMLGYAFLYLSYKLGTFNKRGRGKSWRLLLTISPLLGATLIAISRTADYHHHWQDITIGSILGFVVVFTVYRQYFPSILVDDYEKEHPFFLSNTEGLEEKNGNNSHRGMMRSNPLTSIKTV